MKTIEINVYQFDELSDKAKEKAISHFSDINVEYDWWEDIYQDAENIGLKITEFDQYYNCTGEFITSGFNCAGKILLEHGKDCDTYKAAQAFLSEYKPIKFEWEQNNPGFYFEHEDLGNDMEEAFLKDLLKCYREMLRNEYDEFTSKEAIIDTIRANEYEFSVDGKFPAYLTKIYHF